MKPRSKKDFCNTAATRTKIKWHPIINLSKLRLGGNNNFNKKKKQCCYIYIVCYPMLMMCAGE